MIAQLVNYSVIKFNVFLNKEDTTHFMLTELNGLDETKTFTQNITNLNFAIGVYPKKFGIFNGNIEDFIDVNLQIIKGRKNRIDEDKTLGLHRCTEEDFVHFNKPLHEDKEERVLRKLTNMLCIDDPNDLVL